MSKQVNSLTYRPDIDGLRAIAVLSVVVFHFSPNRLPSGFIGVDIFFVISGFLISSIIFNKLGADKFSILEFYSRRIRRIFPALITIMLASLIVGWFVLLTDEYQLLGKHIAGGSIFISNFVLATEIGYFDLASDLKPMLHLWSLAIEEQFYIFWPLLLIFISGHKWKLLPIITAIILLSFFINLYLLNISPYDSANAFYLPISRFWELLLGAGLAYVNLHHPNLNHQYQNVQSWVGFTLLVAGFYWINSAHQFPGWWALLPTLGTGLLISAGSAAWLNRTILSNKLFVFFGLISYPLYLWHWPLLSFAKIVYIDIDREIKLGLVIAAIFLAWLTYRMIEQPLRHNKHRWTPCLLLITLLTIGLIGYSNIANTTHKTAGPREKEKVEFSKYFTPENLPEFDRHQCNFYDTAKYNTRIITLKPTTIDKECHTRDKSIKNAVLIWGDSHAQHLYSGLLEHLPKSWQILEVASSACRADISHPYDSTTDYCIRSNYVALQTIKQARPNVVIIGQNKFHSVTRMADISLALEKLGVQKVIFTGPTPHWKKDLPKIILRELWNSTEKRSFTGLDMAVLQANEALKRDFKPSQSRIFISIIDYFCNHAGCLTHLGGNKTADITSWDYGHLSPASSSALAKDVLVPTITGNSKATITSN